MAHPDVIPAVCDGSGSKSPIFAAPVKSLTRMARRGAVFGAAVMLAISLLIAAAPVTAQEIVFGGAASFAAGITGNTTDLRAISPFYRLELEPELTIFADTAELRASGAIQQSFAAGSGASLAASLDTLRLRLFPTDRLTVDLGLLRHIPGAAILLSPINYLAPVSLDLAAGGELPSTAGSSALIGATAFIGQGYLSAHVVPAPAVTTLPTVDEDILERVSLLSTLDDEDVGGTLTRSAFVLGETQTVSEPWRRASFGVEAGTALGPVDLTVIYYHGLDRIPTVMGVVDTNGLPPGEFSLSLSAAESVIDAVGASAQTAIGPATLWIDGSYVVGRSFGTTNVVPTATVGLYETETLVVPHVELVAGGLIRVFRPQLLIVAEYRHGFLGSDRTDIIRLDFPGTALVSLTADFADGLFLATGSGIVLVPDRSAVIVGSVMVSPSSELSAYLQAPIVVASDGSLLSGLRSTLSVTAGLTYRF